MATINLAEFAVMDRDVAEATRRFEEGRALSKVLGFADGVRRAEDGLKALKAGN